MFQSNLDPGAKRKLHMLFAWGGPAYVILLCIGVWPMAKMFPPPAPMESVAEIFRRVQENRSGIRLGMIFQMLGAAAFIPFTGVLGHYTAKVEGCFGPLSIALILGCFGNVILTFYPSLWLLLHLYRPEASPELIYHGMTGYWLQFSGGITLFYPVLIVMALCALYDKRVKPLFPRWFGYFCLWNLLLFVPGLLVFFLYSGPFAWNGLMSFWVPLSIFFVWFFFTFHYLRLAILAEVE